MAEELLEKETIMLEDIDRIIENLKEGKDPGEPRPTAEKESAVVPESKQEEPVTASDAVVEDTDEQKAEEGKQEEEAPASNPETD